ncbi:GL19993 [Drosophila persimilis]|uniref:GL19993 n=1 Tax=Drosophila persimilis TaxID=7234 RepID=B4HA48_DROPE|nr:GL22376 [Drosophila persimilis]EDW37815.1 GL19993 [Drosophila persimilis]
MTNGMVRRGSNRRHSDGGRAARRGALAAAAAAIYTNTNSANNSSSSTALGTDTNTNVNANAESQRHSDTFPTSREYPHILIASSPPCIRNK